MRLTSTVRPFGDRIEAKDKDAVDRLMKSETSSRGAYEILLGTTPPGRDQTQRPNRKRADAKSWHSLVYRKNAPRRVVLAFRDQDGAQSRVVTPGTADTKILKSSSHSLFGHPASLDSKYVREKELGRGGNAVVHQVRCVETGKQFACKTIRKELDSQWSATKRAGHLNAIRQEVEVMRRLRGSLNVATLEDIFEEENHVHIVMELCQGGELIHRIGSKHYSERTVASYMRAVLRTIAQCHSQKILHRDVKPGNFLLLSGDDMAPLKAIDFGLAVPFEPESLPKQDLGLEGTPWFQAPEVLSSKVGPEADVWSAGVMAFQLLTGRFPFDDKRNPLQPSVTKVWQAILSDSLDFSKSYWSDISEEAKDFVARLLEKDPTKRPTAVKALSLPWLQGQAHERSTGSPLCSSVVQRIQRYSQSSVLKRTALELIAEDMLTHAVQGAVNSMAKRMGTKANDWEEDVQNLLKSADFGESDHISRHQLSCALQSLGYRIDIKEAEALLDQLDTRHTGEVERRQLAASQIDWAAIQQDHEPQFIEAARRTFSALDTDGDGYWSCEEILECLESRLAPTEVNAGLQQAMREAAKRDESIHKGIDFQSFLLMLRSDSHDSLDQYDDRIGSLADRLSLLLDNTCEVDWQD